MSTYEANMKEELIKKLNELGEKAISFYIFNCDDNPVNPKEAFWLLDFDFDKHYVYEQTHFYCYTENYVISTEYNDDLTISLRETPLSPASCKLYFESGGELISE